MNPLQLLRDERVIAFDIETTGFSRKYGQVIELGCIEYQNGKEVHRFHQLFKGRSPADAIAVHGITNDMLVDKPPFAQYAEGISKYLSGGINKKTGKFRNTILIGHNIVAFDIPFLNAVMKRHGDFEIENYRAIDTLKLAKLIQSKNNSLQLLCEARNIVHGNHRALSDVACTMEVYNHLINELNNDHGYTIDKLEDIFLLSKLKKDLTKDERKQIKELQFL
jgi:DNA polymerase-3 subunit epsilon